MFYNFLHIGLVFLVCFGYSAASGSLRAQNKPTLISGTVSDSSGSPLFGANVVSLNSNHGTVADAQGKFSLKANAQAAYKLEFSYVGFETVVETIDLSKAQKVEVNVILQEIASQLQDVTVTGQGKLAQVRDLAFAVTAIETTKLYNSAFDLNQVLNRSVGVRIRQDGGLGSDFTFSLNGFSGRQVKFYLDGIPIDNFGSSLTPNNFPVNLAQRIEVYKGVVPISLGADALGGAVNIISRSDPNYLDVTYGFGSFNTHRASVNLAHTNMTSGFTIRATSFLNYSDNNYKVNVRPINLQNGQRMPLQEVERFHDLYRSTTAQVEVGVVGKTYADKLLIGLIASGNDKDIQTGVIVDQVFGARTANSSALIPTLKYKKSGFITDNIDVSLYAAYNQAKNQFIDTTRVRYNWLGQSQSTSRAEFFRTQLKNQDNEAIANANVVFKLNNHHSLSFNYLYTHFKRTSEDIENPDNISLLFPQQLGKQIAGLAYQADFEKFTGTLFSKWYALGAASFERIFAASAGNEFRETDTQTTNFGYGGAAAYFILPTLQTKFSFERTYRLPEAVELLGDGLFTRRNSALQPEGSYNLNLGAKYAFDFEPDHHLNLEGNYIFRSAENFIRLDQAISQPIDRQFVNVGNVDTNGFEVDVNYDFKNIFRAGANLTYQNIIDKQETILINNLGGSREIPNLNFGFKVPNLPSLFGNLNFDYTYTFLKDDLKDKTAQKSTNTLNIGYSLNYVKEYFLSPNQLGSNNQDIIPSQVSHNLNASYSFADKKFNISLAIQNLANADLFDNYLLPKPGRSIFINLRYFLDKSIF